MIAAQIDFALLSEISKRVQATIETTVNSVSDKLAQSRQAMTDKRRQLEEEHASTLDALRKRVKIERSATQDKIDNVRATVIKAQEKVDAVKRYIADGEAKISELQQQGHWLFPEKQKGWIPDPKAVAKIGLLKAKIAEKWAEQGGRIAALESAKAVLKLTEGALDHIPIDSDPRIAVVLSRNLVNNGSYLSLKKVASETQKRLDQFGGLIQDIATGIELIHIHGARCECALNQYQGGTVNMVFDYTFRGKRSQKIVSIDLRNPSSMANELYQKLLHAR